MGERECSAGESARIWVEYEVIRQGRGRGEGWIKSRSPCVCVR